MKKSTGPAPHQILFAGQETKAVLVDGSQVTIFVRELPVRYHPLVFRHADKPSELVELCAYTKAGQGTPPAPLFPEVRAPAGYWPVPAGWADNVQPASLVALAEFAGPTLNFTSAAASGRQQLAAQEWKAPLVLAAEEILLPAAEKLTHLLISSLTALSTSAAAIATASSTKPSPGS